MENITLRFATPADGKELLKIYAPFVAQTAVSFEYDVPTEEAFSARIGEIGRQYPWILCEIDGQTAGYAYGSVHMPRAAYMWDAQASVYLDPRFHRRGIATALYGCLFALLKMQGYVNVCVGITVPNEKSIGFHRAMGFSEVGVFKKNGYKLGKWYDVLFMEKALSDYPACPLPPLPIKSIPPEEAEALLRREAALLGQGWQK